MNFMSGLNLVDQKYGRLNVIKKTSCVGAKRPIWECICECGKIKNIKQENLRDGSTKSCGCLNNEKRSARAKNMYSKNNKHNASNQ